MNKHMGIVGVVACAASVCLSCSSSLVERLESDPAMAEIILIQRADPAVALDHAWRRGDKRFLGIAGFSLAVPGVEEVYDTVVVHHGVREIAGGGDTNIDSKRSELIEGATSYAEAYNRLLLKRLEDEAVQVDPK